jgi:hypothetical protein
MNPIMVKMEIDFATIFVSDPLRNIELQFSEKLEEIAHDSDSE